MSEYVLYDTKQDSQSDRTFPDEDTAQEKRQDMISLGKTPEEIEVRQLNGDSTNGTEQPQESEPVEAEVIDHTEPEPVDPESLSQNPIGFLKSVNEDFVNTIKGKPAISKQGFRFIQREFEISTESEVVQFIDNPLGCIVWAKAELPSGYSAEAHGEGYKFENDVSDNEFVRMADTRAKSRAISDLTAAGALAVEELSGE